MGMLGSGGGGGGGGTVAYLGEDGLGGRKDFGQIFWYEQALFGIVHCFRQAPHMSRTGSLHVPWPCVASVFL